MLFLNFLPARLNNFSPTDFPNFYPEMNKSSENPPYNDYRRDTLKYT